MSLFFVLIFALFFKLDVLEKIIWYKIAPSLLVDADQFVDIKSVYLKNFTHVKHMYLNLFLKIIKTRIIITK